MIFKELFSAYPCLHSCENEIRKADLLIKNCYEKGGKLLICGNGGSCADSQHIVGELMKGFIKKRPLPMRLREDLTEKAHIPTELLDSLQMGLPAVSLTDSAALSTAFNNDVNPAYTFAQQLFALWKPHDLAFGISTSGNAENVAAAMLLARGLGLNALGLTGENGGRLKELCTVCIRVPQSETYKIQELHLPVYHALCASVEDYFFKE